MNDQDHDKFSSIRYHLDEIKKILSAETSNHSVHVNPTYESCPLNSNEQQADDHNYSKLNRSDPNNYDTLNPVKYPL